MDQFYKDLPDRIREAVEKDMQDILKETGDETIYTAALVTDSDCVTLFLAVNTLEFLEENGGPESENRWLPDEWGYSDGDNSALAKLSELLFAHDEAMESESDEDGADEKQEDNCRLFFDAVTSALSQLKSAGIFGKQSDKVTCFVSISDDDRAEEVENQSAKQLNTPGLAKEFLNRYA